MKLIRHAVFETNSSSAHSVAIAYNSEVYESYTPDENGTITLQGGEYGWGPEKLTDAIDKMNYLAAYREYGNQNEKWVDVFEQVIKDQTGCTSIEYKLIDDSYIDHESVERHFDYENYDDMKEFLFNPKSILYIDNDNSWHYDVIEEDLDY